jgi:serine/threonine-protein kinase
MPLSSGDRLGPYEILEPLGAGGMGEVYRARDSRVGRDVAIKTSREQFNERFEREARTIAALSHPNICTLFDVGPNYLVMELVEGTTLAARIAEDPIPLEESLRIARQIADALEAAHDKGIVHRDLKPGNVILRSDGSVKVLDFGLAKTMDQGSGIGDRGSVDASQSPTLSMAATQAGVILGTAAYMAPEQARGKAVDARADIWAFGVLLYEMVTGSRLFQGEDLTETLASVIKEQPELRGVPFELRRLLDACLQKDPRHRLRNIADAWKLLDQQPTTTSSVTAPPSRRGWLWPAVAAVLAAAAAGAGWIAWRASQPADLPLVRLEVDLGDVDLGSAGNTVALSPDGTRIAYLATPAAGGPRAIYTRRLDQPLASPLPGTDRAVSLFFSPDGAWIGFVQARQLRKVSVEGGAPVTIAPTVGPSAAAWSDDGYIVYSSGINDGLRRVPDRGGESEVVVPLGDGLLVYEEPQVLPGGKAMLFTSVSAPGQTSVDVFSIESRERTVIVPGGKAGRYLHSGHLIYVLGATLFAVAFDAERLETRGSAVPVLEAVASDNFGSASLAASRNGTLVYRGGGAPQEAVVPRTVEWLDSRGNRTPVIGTPGGYSEVQISPDERRLVLSVLQEGAASDRLVVYDLERGGFNPVTFEDRDHAYPIWSPDGRFIVFSVLSSLFWTRADGAGQPQPLLEKVASLGYSFSPDGRRLAFDQQGDLFDIWTVPLTVEGDRLRAGNPEPFLATRLNEADPMISPDGRWLAYSSNESGRLEVSVRAFPPAASGEGAKFAVSTNGASTPIWSRTTGELYFRGGRDTIMVASYRVTRDDRGESFVAGRPRVWATLDGDLQDARFEDMASDGRALISVPVRAEEPPAPPERQHHVVFLQNFFDHLRRVVPAEGK